MARLAALLVAALVLGLGTGVVVARKAPPAKHHRAHAKKRHKHVKKHPRPATKKPASIPATPAPPVVAPAATPTVPAVTDPVDTPAVTPTPTPLSHALGVTEREFSLSLTRTVVGAGDVMIQVLNWGEDAHDLEIDTADGRKVWKWDELASRTQAAKTIALEPGTYRLYCTLPGHAAAGMDKQITVQAG